MGVAPGKHTFEALWDASEMPATRSRSSGGASTAGTAGRRPAAPLFTILRSRVKQPQFYWFLGHFLTLYHFLRFHLAMYSLRSQRYHYTRILFYISATYAIVLYQFYKSGQLKLGNLLPQLRRLDNMQYFCMLALLFVCSLTGATVSGALYSPVIFSLFHCLNYFKENLLPFLPVTPLVKAVVNNKIGLFIQNHNERYLQMAQVFEIMCGIRAGLFGLPIALLRCLVRFSPANLASAVASLGYVWFFKLRFQQTQSIRLILAQFTLKIDSYADTRLPPQIAAKWHASKQVVQLLFAQVPA